LVYGVAKIPKNKVSRRGEGQDIQDLDPLKHSGETKDG